MNACIGNFCRREVVTVARGTSVEAAAVLMRERHVGAVVVVDERKDGRLPVGILTDRDIAIEIVAAHLDPRAITAGELVQRPLATVSAEASLAEAVREMSRNGVRRLPVVERDGTLAGIVSLDDLIVELVAPLVAVGDLAARERRFEAHTRT